MIYLIVIVIVRMYVVLKIS